MGIWIDLVWWLCLLQGALGLCKVFSHEEMAVNHLYPGISTEAFWLESMYFIL